MLKKTFFGRFAGHPDIEAFQNAIKLRISGSKSIVFSKDFFVKLNKLVRAQDQYKNGLTRLADDFDRRKIASQMLTVID